MDQSTDARTQAAAAIAAARAAADLPGGFILASVEVAATPARVFAALSSSDVIDWWVRPGVFDTRTWEGDVAVGGRWRTSGIGPRGPYELAGEYLEVDQPSRLVHTWQDPQWPEATSTVTYELSGIEERDARHAAPSGGVRDASRVRERCDRLGDELRPPRADACQPGDRRLRGRSANGHRSPRDVSWTTRFGSGMAVGAGAVAWEACASGEREQLA